MTTSRNYRIEWSGVQDIPARDYQCGFCDREISSNRGLKGQGVNLNSNGERATIDGSQPWFITICPRCGCPSFLSRKDQVPGVPFGEIVRYLPADIDALYDEARRSMGANNLNAAVMLGRKLLMHVAVANGAAEGLNFYKYVNYLAEANVITASMKPWVDEIRELGNDANHELPHMTRPEAETMMTFVAMLLRNAYEYPEAHAISVAARAAKDQSAS